MASTKRVGTTPRACRTERAQRRTEPGRARTAFISTSKELYRSCIGRIDAMGQTTAGIRELKNHLSAYLRKVKAGETITITDRGTPVGRIVPARERIVSVGERDERTLEEKMQALQDAGLAEWSGTKLQPREPVTENKGDRMISDLLLEDRR
jgi:prevent-host-death family protein